MTDPGPNAIHAGPRQRIEQLIELLTRECGALAEPEKKLARAVVMGEVCDLLREGDEALALETEQDPWHQWVEHRFIRATMLRAICVREEAHALADPRGVQLKNAWITGGLDLDGARVPFDLQLIGCNFDGPITARGATVRTLSLQGSRVPGLRADGLEASGDVFLNGCFHATGEVQLPSARIGGNLDCSGGCFEHKAGDALNAQGTNVTGILFLRGARFEGTLELTRSRASYLTHSRAGTPNEEPSGEAREWPPKNIILDDCRYDALDSGAPLDTKSRLAWLANHDQTIEKARKKGTANRDQTVKNSREKGTTNHERTNEDSRENGTPPDPGPYRWLATILRKQGQEWDADKVMTRLGWRRMRPLFKQRIHGSAWDKALALPYLIASFLYGAIVGHGYARFRPLVWLLGFWIVGSTIFALPLGQTMQPSQTLALRAWSEAAEGMGGMGGQSSAWLGDYPEFNPIVYSIDAFLPLVDFHQEEYWTPRNGPTAWRWVVKNVYLPFHIIMGWIIATLFAASFTRLARHD